MCRTFSTRLYHHLSIWILSRAPTDMFEKALMKKNAQNCRITYLTSRCAPATPCCQIFSCESAVILLAGAESSAEYSTGTSMVKKLRCLGCFEELFGHSEWCTIHQLCAQAVMLLLERRSKAEEDRRKIVDPLRTNVPWSDRHLEML